MDESSFEDFGEEELKLEPVSPPGTGRFTSSRTSSTGSAHTSSSAHNSDDEDSDSKSTLSYKDRRREAHTLAEQKRRDAIKKGYDQLQTLVPTCQQADSICGYKMSKATILQKSIDFIQYSIQQKKKQEEDVTALRKEVVALQIMRANYETIMRAHQSQPNQANGQLNDEVKFHVFQTIMDNLFQSFNSSLSVVNFNEMSACVFTWLEEYCKPQALRAVVLTVLRQLNSQLS